MRHCIRACFGRVMLSPLEMKDIEELRCLRNRERKWFVHSEEIDSEEQRIWYAKYLETPNDYMFSISQLNNLSTFIGAVALYNVNKESNTCEFGRIIINSLNIPERGLGYDATLCACEIGFEELGMKTILLELFCDNIKAIKTYKRAGFINDTEQDGIIKMVLEKDRFDEIMKKEKEDL